MMNITSNLNDIIGIEDTKNGIIYDKNHQDFELQLSLFKDSPKERENKKVIFKSSATPEQLFYCFNYKSPNVFHDVREFHLKYEFIKESFEKVAFLDDDKMKVKLNHIQEEFDELKRAYEENNIEDSADAIIDLIYVTVALGNLMNLPLELLWNDVHHSNMNYKERVKNLKDATKRGSNYDVKKSENWVGPKGKELINYQQNLNENV